MGALIVAGVVWSAQTTVNTSSDTFKTAWDRQQAMNTELYGYWATIDTEAEIKALYNFEDADIDALISAWVGANVTVPTISDSAYGSGWNTDTDGLSKNAIYDYLHLFDADDDGDFTDEAWFPSTSGAPTDATYLTSEAEAGLSDEDVVSANGLSLVTAADYAAMKVLLDLEIGTDVQAYAAILSVIAAGSGSADMGTASYDFGDATLTLPAGQITSTAMAVNSIDSDSYVDGSIDAVHLAADIVDESKIADDGVDSEHYNDGSVDNVHLSNDAALPAVISGDPDTLDDTLSTNPK